MSTATYDLLAEPRGDTYRALLKHAARFNGRALLVIQGTLAPDGQDLLTRLAPFLDSSDHRSEWPGTRLGPDGKALVNAYTLGDECASILQDATDGLFGWLAPNLPEDLSLLRPDDTPWLVSVAHERDAYVQLSAEEFAALCDAAPGMAEVAVATDLSSDEAEVFLSASREAGVSRATMLLRDWAGLVADCDSTYTDVLDEYLAGLDARHSILLVLERVDHAVVPKTLDVVRRLDERFLRLTRAIEHPIWRPDLSDRDPEKYFFAFRVPLRRGELIEDDLAQVGLAP